MIWQGQQIDDANDAIAYKTTDAIRANVSIDSDNEADGVLDNQFNELEKLDAANEAIVSNQVILVDKADVANKTNKSNKAD